jgi:hypothetical protein
MNAICSARSLDTILTELSQLRSFIDTCTKLYVGMHSEVMDTVSFLAQESVNRNMYLDRLDNYVAGLNDRAV